MMSSFNPARLGLARRRRGKTKTRLAEEASLTPRSLTGYETGERVPQAEAVERLASVLNFPAEFFFLPEPHEIEPVAASFRALSKRTAAERDTALAAAALAVELADWIETRFGLPEPSVPVVREHDPELAAATVRAEWELGERSVSNMIHLLEAHGVRVFSLAQDCEAVDAFSFYRGSTPFVILNLQKSPERSRFDAAHELGHLVMHEHGSPQGREEEKEADRFASALLMPRRSVLAAPPVNTVNQVVSLKAKWKVSATALAHRLYSLGRLSEWKYRAICIEMSKLGFRKKEPEPIQWESSQVLSKVLEALRGEGVSTDHVARDLRISTDDLDALVFGLTWLPMRGGGRGGSLPVTRTPRLVTGNDQEA